MNDITSNRQCQHDIFKVQNLNIILWKSKIRNFEYGLILFLKPTQRTLDDRLKMIYAQLREETNRIFQVTVALKMAQDLYAITAKIVADFVPYNSR